ncbi:MAG TPA: hypothetical protein VIR54_27120 [Vicinamibacterales bacterium]|jgi:hypothetical protein
MPADNCSADVEPSLGRVSVVDQHGHAIRQLPSASSFLDKFSSTAGTINAIDAVALGPLAPHATLVLVAPIYLSDRAGAAAVDSIESGPDTVVFKRNTQSPYHGVGVAAAGDHVRVSVELLDTHCDPPIRAFDVLLRVEIKGDAKLRDVTIDASIGDSQSSKSESIGRATISSAGTSAIKLSVIPGSNQLYGYQRGSCSLTLLQSLEDGIEEGGVAVGPLYGYNPHDTCPVVDQVRFVDIDAAVATA